MIVNFFLIANIVSSDKTFELEESAMFFYRIWFVDYSRWLFIIDNLDEKEIVEILRRRFLTAGMNGSVLVISRYRDAATF